MNKFKSFTEFVSESEEVYHEYDFLGMAAKKLGISREEYIATYGPNTPDGEAEGL